MTAPQFDRSDSYVLYAIAWAGPSGANPEVLEPCFQHLDYLPSHQQLNDAISRLVTSGLARLDGRNLVAERRPAELFESIVCLPARQVPDQFAALLSATLLPSTVEYREYFSAAEMRAAADGYRKRVAKMRPPTDRDAAS